LEGDIHDRKVDEEVELYQYLVNALPENIATTKKKCNEVGVGIDN
jgi:hypothetical protein